MLKRWNDLAKAQMKSLGMTQEKLAERLGLTPGAVSHWLNARRSPGLEEIAQILHILGIDNFSVNSDGLLTPSGESCSKQGALKNTHCYPLVTREIINNHLYDLLENSSAITATEWIESGAALKGQGFWYQVEGDSMLATSGLSIPSGSLVLIDSGRSPIQNDLVLTVDPNGHDLSFKQYVIDSGKKFLASLNPRWPFIELNDEFKILGVAIESKLRFH